MGRSAHSWCLAAAAALAAAAWPAGDGTGDVRAQDAASAEDREWNQEGGSSAHTCSADVAPVRGDPRIDWRVPLPGPPMCEPVCWGGIVYVVAGSGRSRELIAVRAATGEKLGSKWIGGSGELAAGTWQGTVVLADGEKLRGVPMRTDGLGMSWTLQPGNLSSAAFRIPSFSRLTIDRGIAYVQDADGTGLLLVDARTGRVLGGTSFRSRASAVVTGLGDARVALGVWTDRESEVRLDSVKVWASDKKASFNASPGRPIDLRSSGSSEAASAWLAWTGDYATGGSLLGCGWSIRAARGGDLPGFVKPFPRGEPLLASITTRPAVAGGHFYGFTAAGALHKVAPDGHYWELVEAGKLPQGARPGPATLARDVLYLGNWAVDVGTRRVLWCLPGLRPLTPAVPVGDGRIVVCAQGPEMLGLADPSVPPPAAAPAATPRGTPGGAPGDARGAASAAAPPAPSRPPVDLEGAILADGTRIDGVPEAVDGVTWKLTLPGGATRQFDCDELSLVMAGGATLHAGAEFGAYAAWRDAIEDETVAAYSELFKRALSESLLDLCARYLGVARAYGIDDRSAERLERMLTGRSRHPNSDLKVKRYAPLEAEAAAGVTARCVEASKWLDERGFPVAAAAVLAHASRGGLADTGVLGRAAELLPPEFPFAKDGQPGRAWIRWASELIPAGGRFCTAGDPVWRRIRGEPAWADGTLAIRTRNLVFFSRCRDAAVVGACARNGEGAIRMLDTLLAGGAPARVIADDDRLEVRLHSNQKDYLAERPPDSGGAMEWSAGYYSPGSSISRFYVPTEKETAAARDRSLFKVLAHELTHHYVHRRFCGVDRGGVRQPGYWVVEGIAEFVEDQTVEAGRRGLRFDDRTVNSLDSASQVDAAGALILPLSRFADLSHADMLAFDAKKVAEVRLRNTLQGFQLDARQVFYAQSGALVFWLMHERGDAGREALRGHLRRFYSGSAGRGVWRELGFGDAAEFESGFRSFLQKLAK